MIGVRVLMAISHGSSFPTFEKARNTMLRLKLFGKTASARGFNGSFRSVACSSDFLASLQNVYLCFSCKTQMASLYATLASSW